MKEFEVYIMHVLVNRLYLEDKELAVAVARKIHGPAVIVKEVKK